MEDGKATVERDRDTSLLCRTVGPDAMVKYNTALFGAWPLFSFRIGGSSRFFRLGHYYYVRIL